MRTFEYVKLIRSLMKATKILNVRKIDNNDAQIVAPKEIFNLEQRDNTTA